MNLRINLQKELERIKDWRKDIKSKLLDGFLVFVLSSLAVLLLSLLVEPFEMLLGKPGLLIYALVLLAVSMISLDRGLVQRESVTISAWFGIASGISSWLFVKLTGEVGVIQMDNTGHLLLMLLVVLASLSFWRRGLPSGGRFFLAVFMLNWIAQFITDVWYQLEARYQHLPRIPEFFGYASLILLLALVVWILFYTEKPLQRTWLAVLMWFFLTLTVYSFWGQII